MNERTILSAVRKAGPSALCGYWIWALLASPDSRVVLDCRVHLPLAGMDVGSGVFFVAAPLIAFGIFFATRPKPRKGWSRLVPFPAALLLNSFRCLKLHDPELTRFAAAVALVGTAWAVWEWLESRPFRGRRASARDMPAAAGFAAAVGLEAFLVIFLIPWSLRGDLPRRINNYPFGPALRSVVYADLAGYERQAGSGQRSLRGLHLEGANLCGAILKGIDLRGAHLLGARFDRADLEGADLRGARLVQARLSFINLRRADLSDADLSGAYSMGGDLRGAVLRGSGHQNQSFCNADARGADFGYARLSTSLFFGSDLRGASFRGAALPDAGFVRARLDDADLTGAFLPGADFYEAVLRGAILRDANLCSALRLVPDALAEAATLRSARLDPALSEEMRRRAPGLF